MKSETNDIYEMLDILALPVAAQRFAQLSESPELGSYTALQFIREVLEPQYIETLNKRFETNLRLSSLINKGAVAENLKTGNGRIYNDATVEQVLKFHFAENRQNVGIYGVTGAGKSYFLSACCVEACKRNYRCKFVDYSDLLDELIVLNRQEDLSKYRRESDTMRGSSCCSLMTLRSADTPRKGSRSCTTSSNFGMTLGPPPSSPASILRMNGETS